MKNSTGLYCVSVAACIVSIAIVGAPNLAQAQTSSTTNPAEELENNGQPPSDSVPQTPASQINQQEDQRIQQENNTLQNQLKKEEPQLRRQGEMQDEDTQQEEDTPENVDEPNQAPAPSDTPEQDEPDQITIP
jgi:hypothetical protein